MKPLQYSLASGIEKIKHCISLKKVKITHGFFLFLSLLLIFLLSATSISVFRTRNILETGIFRDSLKIESRKANLSGEASYLILKNISYKEALLKLSAMDSIGLIIDLPDSSLQLGMHGVIIHTSKISLIQKDPLIDRIDPLARSILFSEPQEILSQFSTIVKEPVVVRKAPKDTTEARINAWKPGTMVQKPAHFEIDIPGGIRIIFSQEKTVGFSDWYVKSAFYLKQNIKHAGSNINQLLHFNWYEYTPEIRIELPDEELRAIYRALPEHAYVVINY